MLTVIIPTRNGASTLPETLETLCSVHPPRGGWKLVVVDNGSTDTTPAVIRSFMHRLPLSSDLEVTPGKTRATNRGLQHLDGDLAVFTDDDTVPDRSWLVAFRDAADRCRDFGVFGGVVVPKWQVPPPAWILDWNLVAGYTYAASDPRLVEGPVDPVQVFGPSMAVRADIFRAGHRFDETVGPCGTSYAMGSETELMLRLARAGHLSWHCPAALVQHIVRPEQMTADWILRRSLRYGRGHFRREAQTWSVWPPRLLGVPRYLLRATTEQCFRVLAARLRGDPRDLFMQRLELRYLIGRVIESRLMSKRMAQRSAASMSTPVPHAGQPR
jgi:GT2 family glycosyltransferase